MTTRRQFLTTSAALPVLYNFQPGFLCADEVPTPATERQPSTQVILSFATEVADEPKDFDHIKALAEFLTQEGLIGNFHLTGDYAADLASIQQHYAAARGRHAGRFGVRDDPGHRSAGEVAPENEGRKG